MISLGGLSGVIVRVAVVTVSDCDCDAGWCQASQ